MIDTSGYAAYLSAHDKTTRTPLQALAVFDRYLDERQIPLAAGLSVAGIMEYAAHIKRRHLAPRSRASYLAAVSSFYRYAVRSGIITPTPAEYETARQELNDLLADLGRTIKRQPLHERLPSPEIVARVLETARGLDNPVPDDANEHVDRLRDKSLILALACTGARVSELAGLKRGDLLPELHAATVRGKGGKRRVVYFSDEAWQAMEQYLVLRCDDFSVKSRELLPIWSSYVGASFSQKSLSVRQMQRIVHSVAERAGVCDEFHLTPHAFRHYVATEFLRKSHDLAMTQDLLGHASPATTRVYASTDAGALRQLHAEIFNHA